jgi:hypothetical protein
LVCDRAENNTDGGFYGGDRFTTVIILRIAFEAHWSGQFSSLPMEDLAAVCLLDEDRFEWWRAHVKIIL